MTIFAASFSSHPCLTGLRWGGRNVKQGMSHLNVMIILKLNINPIKSSDLSNVGSSATEKEVLESNKRENNLKSYEEDLLMDLITNHHFMILGDATDFIMKWADSKGVEVISMNLHSIDDIRGEKVIVYYNSTPCSDRQNWWLEMVAQNPDKKYLMLFYVDEADNRTINALKSFLENHPDNLFYGIISRDPNKEIRSTINSLCGGRPIVWGEEE